MRIGTRGSQLALWQANHVAEALRALGHTVEIEIIRTTGDRMQQASFDAAGKTLGKGIFTKEIEDALADNHVDLAVHSYKDLPTELDSRFTIAAVPAREDARDAFVSVNYESLEALPSGARVGTGSLRRQSQLLAMRRDVECVDIRGNIDTRLRKLADREVDALILAAAGLERIGRIENVRHRFNVEEMCPAAGQGALAIECRNGDSATIGVLAALEDSAARFATDCERGVLAALGGGCMVPIGVHCRADGDAYMTIAVVANPAGTRIIRSQQRGHQEAVLGAAVAEDLLAQGAVEILNGEQ
jgi:hydroxymethylbilane synthase